MRYGRLLSAPTIERGVEATLRAFLGVYVGEVLAQAGHDRFGLPDPTDLVRVSDFEWPTETAVALVVIATDGTAGDAQRGTGEDGQGIFAQGYTAAWETTVLILADLGDRLRSREAAQFYAAAAGAALAHQGVASVDADGQAVIDEATGAVVPLEGASVTWLGEAYRRVGTAGDRALIAGGARVLVTVENARSAYGGPDVPPAPAERPEGTDGPEAVSATATIRAVPVDEEF